MPDIVFGNDPFDFINEIPRKEIINNEKDKKSMNFYKGQKVFVYDISDYGGDKLVKNKELTVSIVGKNVVGFNEILGLDGEPLKFFKYYFKPIEDKAIPYIRVNDIIIHKNNSYKVSSVDVEKDELYLTRIMDKRRKVLLKLSETDTYKILEQSLKKKDKVSFIPLEEVRPYKDGNTYYIKDCMISANDLHELYMKLENSLLTVSEITDNGYYCKFKEVNNGTWFSSRIIRVITPAKENKLAERGDTIVVMKGSILPIGEQHTILDIVKLSTKRIYGVKTPHKENGMTYIDSKFCKLKKNEKELEKKVG